MDRQRAGFKVDFPFQESLTLLRPPLVFGKSMATRFSLALTAPAVAIFCGGCSSSPSGVEPPGGVLTTSPWGKSEHVKGASIFGAPESAGARQASSPPNWSKLKAGLSMRDVETILGPIERSGAWRLEFADGRAGDPPSSIRYVQGLYYLAFSWDASLLKLTEWGMQLPEKP